MLKSKKFIVVCAVLIVGLGGAYAKAHGKPKASERVKGTIYEMPKAFLLNLSGNHYAKVSVALELAPGQSTGAAAGSTSTSEEGPGTLPEEALVRAIVTNVITGRPGSDLVDEGGRHQIEHQILQAINHQTDVKTEAVLFPDLTVQ